MWPCKQQQTHGRGAEWAAPVKAQEAGGKLHLYHEAADGPVEDGVLVVPAFREHEEVLTGARRYVAVQLQVEISQAGVHLHVPLLLGVALYPDLHAVVLRVHIHGR